MVMRTVLPPTLNAFLLVGGRRPGARGAGVAGGKSAGRARVGEFVNGVSLGCEIPAPLSEAHMGGDELAAGCLRNEIPDPCAKFAVWDVPEPETAAQPRAGTAVAVPLRGRPVAFPQFME